MTTLGEAFIEVHADTKPFAKELARELRMILAEVDKVTKAESTKIGKGISKGIADGVDKDSSRIKRAFTGIGDFIQSEGNRWEDSLRKSFTKMARGNFILTRMFGQASLAIGGATKRVLAFGKGLFNLLGGIFDVAKGLGTGLIEGFKALVGVGGDAAKVTGALSAGFARVGASLAAAAAEAVAAAPVLAALLVVVIALAAAMAALAITIVTVAAPFAMLLNLALAIPAALTTILAIVAPLIIAFKDMGDAMELVFEKDPDKLKEGLAKLSPVMREIVGILRQFAPDFQRFAAVIQESFFRPFIREIKPALEAMLPVLQGHFSRIASALGVMVANVFKFLSQRPVIEAVASVLGQIADFLERNSGTLARLIAAMGAAATAALPIVLELLDKFGGFLIKFAEWIMGAITDGRFEQWLRKGIEALQVIWNLVKAIILLFSTLFVILNVHGQEFLKTITDAINRFRNWANSKDGKAALEAMGKLAVIIAKALSGALRATQDILTVVGRIYSMWRAIRSLMSGGGSGQGASIGSAAAAAAAAAGNVYSGGGVVPQDQVAMVHAGEPILDPANSVERNRAILSDAGLLDVLSEPTVVNVYIGTERLDARIDYRVSRDNRSNARTLTSGPRS